MGLLKQALTPISSHAAKKTTLWEDLIDEIDGAFMPSQLDEIEARMDARPNDYPGAWLEPLAERIERRREELASEDISQIMRDRFSF